jgi:hypothetical protein
MMGFNELTTDQEEFDLDTFTWEKKQSLKIRREYYPTEAAFRDAMQLMWNTNRAVYYSSLFSKPQHDCSKEDIRKSCELSIELSLDRARRSDESDLIDLLSKVGTYGAFTGKGKFDEAWVNTPYTITDFLPDFTRQSMTGDN